MAENNATTAIIPGIETIALDDNQEFEENIDLLSDELNQETPMDSVPIAQPSAAPASNVLEASVDAARTIFPGNNPPPHESAVHKDLSEHIAPDDEDDSSVDSDPGVAPTGEKVCAPTVEQVISIDQLKHGAATALEFFGWGVSQVNTAAENLKNNEKVKEMVQTIQPGIDKIKHDAVEAGGKVQEIIQPGLGKIKQDAVEASAKISEASTSLYEKAKPGIEDVAKGAERTFQSIAENFKSWGSK